MFPSPRLYFPWLKKFCFGSCYPVEVVSQYGRSVQRGKCTSLAEARRMGVRGDGRCWVGEKGPHPLHPFRKNIALPNQLRASSPRPGDRSSCLLLRACSWKRIGEVGWERSPQPTGHLLSANQSSAFYFGGQWVALPLLCKWETEA